MHLCYVLFIGDEGWNLHASTTTGRPLSGGRWPFSDESRFMLYRTDGCRCIRHEKPESKHPLTIVGRSIMVWEIFSWDSMGAFIIVEGMINRYKYASVFADDVPTCEVFFLKMMASTSRTVRSVIEIVVYVRGSKGASMSLCHTLLAGKLPKLKFNWESAEASQSGVCAVDSYRVT